MPKIFEWFEMDGSRIPFSEYMAKTKANPRWRQILKTDVGERFVSTVLLGTDHGYGGVPIIFESMTFPDLEVCERYATIEQEREGHARMVAVVEAQARMKP